MKKKLNNTTLTLVTWLGLADSAHASTGVEEGSGIFIWIFLALCALIIIGQLVPALLMLTGFAKGLKKKEQKEAVEAEPKKAGT
jgi:hypothetical protein